MPGPPLGPLAPDNFADTDDVKAYLGAFLPGDAEFTEDPVKEEMETNFEAPASFDSIDQWPQCSVITNVRDQPSCGSCWAFGSVSSFEARACIATGKDVKYSPEQTAFCFNYDGCGGGNNVWSRFQSTGVVTGGDYSDTKGDTCSRYSLMHAPTTSLRMPSTLPARPPSTTLKAAQPAAKLPAGHSLRTRCMQHPPILSVARPTSWLSWHRMDLCMCLSLSMVISQRTKVVSTSLPLPSTLAVTQSPWSATEPSTVRSTGRSRTAGTRIGATMATS